MLIKSDWSMDPVEKQDNVWEWFVLFWWVLSCIWFEFGLLHLFCFGKESDNIEIILQWFIIYFSYLCHWNIKSFQMLCNSTSLGEPAQKTLSAVKFATYLNSIFYPD